MALNICLDVHVMLGSGSQPVYIQQYSSTIYNIYIHIYLCILCIDLATVEMASDPLPALLAIIIYVKNLNFASKKKIPLPIFICQVLYQVLFKILVCICHIVSSVLAWSICTLILFVSCTEHIGITSSIVFSFSLHLQIICTSTVLTVLSAVHQTARWGGFESNPRRAIKRQGH